MDDKVKNIVEYTVALISEFGKKYGLSDRDAYQYISLHDGMKLIEDNYGIMHTLTFDDAVAALASYCHRQGGEII